jgi:hypothetical protein
MQQFETPSGVSDYYTHRVRGYLHPPATGNYEFWLATDDDGELWLSTTDQPANKVRIAYIQANWASPREWNKHLTQHSVSIPLVAGQRYYIEALQSEGSGGDNLAVGWSGPGLPAGINVVAGRYLSPPATLPPGTTSPPGARHRPCASVFHPVVCRAKCAPELCDRYRCASHHGTGILPQWSGAETFYNGNGIFSQVGGSFPSGSWQAGDARFDYNFASSAGRI